MTVSKMQYNMYTMYTNMYTWYNITYYNSEHLQMSVFSTKVLKFFEHNGEILIKVFI